MLRADEAAPTPPAALRDTPSENFDDRTAAISAGVIILTFTALRLWLALKFPLAPDETYYWEWSRRPDWGYYDQGPMIAWWIRLGCSVFGDTEIGIRAPIIAAGALTQVFLFLLARDLAGSRAALIATIVGGITPMALAGGFIATYDPLMALFWTAGVYFAARAIFREDRRSWAAFGTALGLGFLAKHTMALLPFCLVLFLSRPGHRYWFRKPEPYLALLLAIAIFSPNLWWQARHEWMTFEHLFVLTGKGTDHPFLRRFGDFAGSQLFLITPLLFFGFLGAMKWGWRRRGEAQGDRWYFLFCTSAPVLLLFLVMTAKSKVQANWAIAGWVTPPILYAGCIERAGRNAVRFAIPAIILCGLISALVALPELRRSVGINIPARWDQMNKLYGGRVLAAAMDNSRERLRRETGASVRVGSTTYDATSRISFYMRGQPEACNLFLGTRPNSYLLWQAKECPRVGDNMILSDDHAPDEPDRPPFEAVFARVVPEPKEIPVWRAGVYDEPVHTYYLYRCYGYRPNPAIERPSGGSFD